MNLYQGDERDYDTSFGEGVWQSIKMSSVISCLLCAFIAIVDGKTDSLNTVAHFIGISFSTILFSGIITLALSFVVIYPMIYTLRFFSLLNDINIALVSGIAMFAALMSIPRDGFISFYYVIVFWAMVCGYAFMQGYNKGGKQ